MDSDDPEEFESRWSKLMSTTSLSQNKWVNDMYTIRAMWIPAYLKNIFSAGMSSSQRAESNHSFFKKYLSRDCSLNDVFTRFRNAISRQRHKTLLLDHADKNEKPSLNSTQPMERQLSTSCQKFNDMGIPCRHMLYMMQVMQIKLLPEEYILSRWTQEVGSPISFQTVASPIIQARGYIERSRGLSEKWKWLIEKAALTEKSTIILHKMFEEAESKIQENEVVTPSDTQESCSGKGHKGEGFVSDPTTNRVARGRKRLLSMRDKAIKSGGKHCRNCGKVGHNARTCPEIKGKDRIADEVEPYRPSPLSNNIIVEDSQEMTGRDMVDTVDEGYDYTNQAWVEGGYGVNVPCSRIEWRWSSADWMAAGLQALSSAVSPLTWGHDIHVPVCMLKSALRVSMLVGHDMDGR
ncbi:FAR1-related protein [Striga asiatica]|uniref:FAR1-related protein n=1 Tax=Striga asiatica TaxID=4170 RepID=A0A5A7QRD1_STRAF|nr:FAR1-related protein [Striga asiatica]